MHKYVELYHRSSWRKITLSRSDLLVDRLIFLNPHCKESQQHPSQHSLSFSLFVSQGIRESIKKLKVAPQGPKCFPSQGLWSGPLPSMHQEHMFSNDCSKKAAHILEQFLLTNPRIVFSGLFFSLTIFVLLSWPGKEPLYSAELLFDGLALELWKFCFYGNGTLKIHWHFIIKPMSCLLKADSCLLFLAFMT